MSKIAFAQGTFAFVVIVWLGILLGVSFLATPVKFEAPSLSLPVALEVGRVTFALLSKVEWGLCTMLLVSALVAGRPEWVGAGLGLAGFLVVQALWLLPILDDRVGLIIAGQPVAPTSHHLIFVGVEAVKVLMLFGLAVYALARPAVARRYNRVGLSPL
jgi:hypothetical protein